MNHKIVKYDITNTLSLQYSIYNIYCKCTQLMYDFLLKCVLICSYGTQQVPHNIIMLIYKLLTSAFFLANMS